MARFESLSSSELKESISEIIRRHLPGLAGEPLWDDADLCALGMDSLHFVWMLAELDRELGLEIPDDLFTLENFRTLRATLETVVRVRQTART